MNHIEGPCRLWGIRISGLYSPTFRGDRTRDSLVYTRTTPLTTAFTWNTIAVLLTTGQNLGVFKSGNPLEAGYLQLVPTTNAVCEL